MKKIAFILFPFLLFGYETLNFKDAKKLLFQNNITLKIQEEKIKASDLEKSSHYSLFLPQIDLEYQYIRLDEPIEINKNFHINALNANIPLHVPIQDKTYSKANISAIWPLYTGGQITAAKESLSLKNEIAINEKDQIQNKIFLQFIERYFSLVLAKEMLDIEIEEEESLKMHLFNTETKFNEGMIPKLEVLHAKVAFSHAKTRTINSNRNHAKAQIALEDLMGKRIESSSKLEKILLPKNLTLKNTHPILEKIENTKSLAQKNYQANLGKFHPQVYLFGKKELIKKNLTLLEPEWSAGVGIKLNLLDRDSMLKKTQIAKIQELEASLTKEDILKSLVTLQNIKEQDLLKARDEQNSLEETLELALESLDARKKAYNAGFATSVDVVDAQLDHSKIKMAISTSQFDEIIALAQLLDSYGRLDEFELYLEN